MLVVSIRDGKTFELRETPNSHYTKSVQRKLLMARVMTSGTVIASALATMDNPHPSSYGSNLDYGEGSETRWRSVISLMR